MNRITKDIGPYVKVTFKRQLPYSIPGQCVKLDGKWFAIYEVNPGDFSILVNKNSHYAENDPQEISEPLGEGFTASLCKRAIVVGGGTGIGAVMPVIKNRNRHGLSTDVIFYTRGDISPIRLDQATIGMCRNVIFWDTTKQGRPSTPLEPLVDKQAESTIFVAGPKSLVTATEEAARNYNFDCYTNF
jgi:NAD(P)H-flavin reductase